MSQLDSLLRELKCWGESPAAMRLSTEIAYARRVSLVNGDKYDTLITDAIAAAQEAFRADGAITTSTVTAIEQLLMPMQPDCKQYKHLYVGHAHIDMNWMWRYDETVSITLDTFRTMLNLMKDFPQFTFAQSQASVYEIVEKYEPAMLDEIRDCIRAGQWEVTASTWVEADRNLPSAESIARHQLYTKRYLPRLLGIEPDTLNLDFEPDTFGHNENVPEMLAAAGIKFYYHCRGEQGYQLYRWQGPSGKSILVYLEPSWYGGYPLSTSDPLRAPEFCETYGVECSLTVYGVGDHGGGPTRRDLERICDMMTWPIFPVIEFGTYAKFYAAMERATGKIPVLTGERNAVFTGCYTTQTRIKQGNRMGEGLLFEAEGLNAFAHLQADAPYDRQNFEQGWRNVLFNQFHDIIPGSGVIDTREYAMGLYSQSYAIANSAKRNAFAAVSAKIDTASFLPQSPEGTCSEGAGVGFGVYGYQLGNVERGGGNTRILHAYNPLPYARTACIDYTLWDFKEDLDRIEILDANGKPVRFQQLDRNFNGYWGHDYVRLLIEADLPACGYTTFGLRLKDSVEPKCLFGGDLRREIPLDLVLENDCLRAKFDRVTGALVSLTDKRTGEVRVKGAAFRLVNEDPSDGMTSWRIGRYRTVETLAGSSTIRRVQDGALRQALEVDLPFGASRLTYTVSLDAGSDHLDYAIRCDWQERGNSQAGIPQLQFAAMLPEAQAEYLYDEPMGVIRRPSQPMDLPSQGMIATVGKKPVTLLSDCKYGMRGDGDTMLTTLIRSSYDPDPYPENGNHVIRLALGVADVGSDTALLQRAHSWNHPAVVVSGTAHQGTAPLQDAFLTLSDNAILSAVKLCEDDDGLLVRVYEADGNDATVALTFNRPVASAVCVDTMEQPVEQPLPAVDGCTVSLPLSAFCVQAVKVTF